MDNSIIFLSNVRLSFPHIAEPQARTNDKGETTYSYNADFLLAEGHPDWPKFMAAMGAVAAAKWAEHATQVITLINADRRQRCYGDGAEKINKKTFEPYDGYAGAKYITANNKSMPQIIQPDGNPADPSNTMMCSQLARRLYGGCYVNVAVKPWAQDNTHGRGLRCDLVAVQFQADGDAFGEGATDASEMFGAAATPTGGPTAGGLDAPIAPSATEGFAAPGMPDFMK